MMARVGEACLTEAIESITEYALPHQGITEKLKDSIELMKGKTA